MAARSASSERLSWALERLVECRSTTAVVTEMAARWGCSRRTAQRLVAKAHAVLVADLENSGLDRREMLAQLIHGLQEALAKALASNQPAAAVAAVRAIADLCQLTTPQRRP
jgi:hypothetical protein